MVDFPTPEGPEMTMSLLLGEVLKEGPALVGSKAPDCTVVRDADFLEEPLGAHLAHVGHGDDDRLDLCTCHQIVLVCPVKDILEAETAGLEEMLDLGAGSASLSRSRKSRRPLFFCHLWEHVASFELHRINRLVEFR